MNTAPGRRSRHNPLWRNPFSQPQKPPTLVGDEVTRLGNAPSPPSPVAADVSSALIFPQQQMEQTHVRCYEVQGEETR
jgi:hypothetical protein